MGQGNERDEAASDQDDLVRVFRNRKNEESRPMYADEISQCDRLQVQHFAVPFFAG